MNFIDEAEARLAEAKPTTVGELIEALRHFPLDAPVVTTELEAEWDTWYLYFAPVQLPLIMNSDGAVEIVSVLG